MKVIAVSPSNIALVKYMGKSDSQLNLPANDSISMTLKDLCTVVEVSNCESEFHRWLPETPTWNTRYPLTVPDLASAGVERMLKHVDRVVSLAPQCFGEFGLTFQKTGGLVIKSANTFPASCGIASSASSFSAVTLGVLRHCVQEGDRFLDLWKTNVGFRRKTAWLSRQGSGSSCRSMEGPWVVWQGENARRLDVKTEPIHHFLLLISETHKQVSSSEAHRRVVDSPLWHGRVDRANERVQRIQTALDQGNLKTVSEIVWQEFFEMHSLFHTSQPPFTYWEGPTLEVIRWLTPFMKGETPPIVTMDAGANLHLMVPQSQAGEWRQNFEEKFPEWECLEDRQGTGAEFFLEVSQ